MKRLFLHFGALVLVFAMVAPVMAEDDMATLRRQLAEQQALIRIQQQQLEKQAQALDKMNRRLDEMAAGKTDAAPAVVSPSAATADTKTDVPPVDSNVRDIVGDLNSKAVRAGDFPGAFKIPGTRNVSLAIGGFVKAAAIADSDAEAMGSDFTPAYLGTKRTDTDGAFNIDATLTKVFLDGRAPAKNGLLRAYIEWDLNNANDGNIAVKMRHAYGSWKNPYGTLLIGHTWSTMMDLKILPEGLTEPTVSGAIFVRQPQIRWSQPLAESFTLHAAIEDPSSSDIFDSTNTPELGNTRLPDGIVGLEYTRKGVGHLRLNGILRDIEVNLPTGDDNEAAWGLALTGHLEFLERDSLRGGFAYGQGLGRYLLGIQSTAGSVVTPSNELDLRDNWGGFAAYQHHWTEALRSNFMAGYTKSDSEDWQAGNTFESSTYAACNLLWQVLPYMTLGVEYGYGQRENKDGSELDNHRVAVGFQFY